ncbi:uncharacterized protein [Diadema setosum]|uniref:uncharacterized protein n=1 Tax=Diadema setosum TaxID=31175 RepID=UPI003B3A655B
MDSNPSGSDVERGDASDPPGYSNDSRSSFNRYVGVGGGTLTPAGSYVPLTPSANHPYTRPYNDRVGKMTGLLQIFCGSVTAIMGLLALVLHAHDYFMDLPLWAGLLYLFGGVFGVSTSKNQTFMIGLYLLFSTLSSMMSSVLVVTEGHATFMEANHCDCSIIQNTHMLYDATAALISCLELLVTGVAMYHCMAGLGCCGCCETSTTRASTRDSAYPPTLLDFSRIPLPPAPIYPVLGPEGSEKVPLE